MAKKKETVITDITAEKAPKRKRKVVQRMRFGKGLVRNPKGAPRKMTAEPLAQLEQAYSLGCTDAEACFAAGISKSTLSSFQVDNPEWLERKQLLREKMVLKAKAVIEHALSNFDVATARWFLEKRCREEYGNEVKVSGDINIKQAIVSWAKVIDSESQEVNALPAEQTQVIEASAEPIAIEYKEENNGASNS